MIRLSWAAMAVILLTACGATSPDAPKGRRSDVAVMTDDLMAAVTPAPGIKVASRPVTKQLIEERNRRLAWAKLSPVAPVKQLSAAALRKGLVGKIIVYAPVGYHFSSEMHFGAKQTYTISTVGGVVSVTKRAGTYNVNDYGAISVDEISEAGHFQQSFVIYIDGKSHAFQKFLINRLNGRDIKFENKSYPIEIFMDDNIL